MVFTLHRYILRELLKVFVLAATALTLMLSLGSLLRPLQDFGVSPGQVIRLLGYLLPITLTFVLPIAALFAASLVYGRFASDNELDACRASGISLWTMIYPGLVLAILVAITTLLLSFYVMPNYVHRAEKAIKADAKQILFRNLQRKGSYELPGRSHTVYRIHADDVHPEKNELVGVIVVETKNSLTTKIITSKRAEVIIEPHKHFNQVRVVAYDAYEFDEQTQAHSEAIPIEAELGSMLSDKIKFKEISEMKKIRSDPMQFDPIARLANQTYLQLIAELLAKDIAGKLAAGSQIQLRGSKYTVRFLADSCKANKNAHVELVGNVVVHEYEEIKKTAQPDFTYKSSRAILELQNSPSGPFLEMVVANTPEWTRSDGTKGWSNQHIIRDIALPMSIGQKISPDILKTISAMPTLLGQPSPDLQDLNVRLNRAIKIALSDIDIEINSRLVFGIGCIALILIGTGLGIILKGGHMLTAFGASSIPAAILIVCIMMGKNLADAFGYIGILLMWSSLAILMVMMAFVYRKLLRN
jgi:lipopolysaccharide export system permease protein